MRKAKYILAVLVAVVSIGAEAQQRLAVPEYYIGFRAGAMASTMLFSPEVFYMTPIYNACILSPTGGLVFRYVGQKYCGLQVELNYQQRGWAEKDEALVYARRMHYIDVPLLMHLHFGKKAGRFTFTLGPEIGYCVKDDGGNGVVVNYDGDEYGEIRKFDWGLTGGIGGQVRTRKAGFYELEARFSFGLGALFDPMETDFKTMSSPMELTVNVGWYWPLRARGDSNNKITRKQINKGTK